MTTTCKHLYTYFVLYVDVSTQITEVQPGESVTIVLEAKDQLGNPREAVWSVSRPQQDTVCVCMRACVRACVCARVYVLACVHVCTYVHACDYM